MNGFSDFPPQQALQESETPYRSLHATRRRIDVLKRKLAPELAFVRLRRLAGEFSNEWDEAISGKKPAPRHALDAKISAFILRIRRVRIRRVRIRINTFMALRKYLERCIEGSRAPRTSRHRGRPAALGREPWLAPGFPLVTRHRDVRAVGS